MGRQRWSLNYPSSLLFSLQIWGRSSETIRPSAYTSEAPSAQRHAPRPLWSPLSFRLPIFRSPSTFSNARLECPWFLGLTSAAFRLFTVVTSAMRWYVWSIPVGMQNAWRCLSYGRRPFNSNPISPSIACWSNCNRRRTLTHGSCAKGRRRIAHAHTRRRWKPCKTNFN